VTFFESYLTYRNKPYIDAISTPKSSLFLLDKLVSLVFYRLTVTQNEHHLLLHLLPRPHFIVHKPSKNIQTQDELDKKQLDEQYAQYLQFSIKFLKFPFLLNLIGILGESNHTLRCEIYNKLIHFIYPSPLQARQEIQRAIQETQKVKTFAF